MAVTRDTRHYGLAEEKRLLELAGDSVSVVYVENRLEESESKVRE